MDYITIGQVLKPKGIKGEIKVRPLTDDIHRFDKLRLIYIDKLPHKINKLSYEGSFVILSLQNINDRNDAEKLRDKEVMIDKLNAIDPGDDAYFIDDIIGCAVVSNDGQEIGTIMHIDSFGSADVITCKNNSGKECRFPFLNKIVDNIDIQNKKFVIKKELWQEVVVFDD